MDHIVYLDKKAKELEKISVGEKTMIIRGAAGRKLPYGRVAKNDELSKEEADELIKNNMDKLQLTPAQVKRWAGKRYLVLIEVKDFKEIEPFEFDRTEFSNMDDWLIVEDIEKIKI